jgi:hypothetical protein
MENQENFQLYLRQKANLILGWLSPSEQKELLIKFLISHSANTVL